MGGDYFRRGLIVGLRPWRTMPARGVTGPKCLPERVKSLFIGRINFLPELAHRRVKPFAVLIAQPDTGGIIKGQNSRPESLAGINGPPLSFQKRAHKSRTGISMWIIKRQTFAEHNPIHTPLVRKINFCQITSVAIFSQIITVHGKFFIFDHVPKRSAGLRSVILLAMIVIGRLRSVYSLKTIYISAPGIQSVSVRNPFYPHKIFPGLSCKGSNYKKKYGKIQKETCFKKYRKSQAALLSFPL